MFWRIGCFIYEAVLVVFFIDGLFSDRWWYQCPLGVFLILMVGILISIELIRYTCSTCGRVARADRCDGWRRTYPSVVWISRVKNLWRRVTRRPTVHYGVGVTTCDDCLFVAAHMPSVTFWLEEV